VIVLEMTMENNSFFKPTPLYKEFMILDLIEKNKDITQRHISDELGIAVSMVNKYLDEYEEKKLIKRKKYSTKTVEYFVTKKGIERKRYLNIGYLHSTQKLYDSAKENIVSFLDQMIDKGFKNILLYGAGEVAEILLQTIKTDNSIPINVLAVIDDDKDKQGQYLLTAKVISLDEINQIEHDGILISSYTNNEIILNKLLKNTYSGNKIIQFFD